MPLSLRDFAIFFIFVFVSFGCSKKLSTPQPLLQGPLTLQGFYFNCGANGGGSVGTSLDFFGASFKFEYTTYTDPACQTRDANAAQTMEGSFSVARNAAGGLNKLDLHATSPLNSILHTVYKLDGDNFQTNECSGPACDSEATRPTAVNPTVYVRRPLNGTYVACVPIGGASAKITETFTGGTDFVMTYEAYSDAACQVRDASAAQTASGTFALLGDAASPAGAQKLNLHTTLPVATTIYTVVKIIDGNTIQENLCSGGQCQSDSSRPSTLDTVFLQIR